MLLRVRQSGAVVVPLRGAVFHPAEAALNLSGVPLAALEWPRSEVVGIEGRRGRSEGGDGGGGPFSADGSTDAVEGSWTFAGYFGTFCSKAGIMTSAVICPHHLIQWRPMVIKHYSPNLVDFNVWVYDIVCTLGS